MRRLALLALVLVIATAAGFWLISMVTLTLYPTMDSYGWQSVPLANNGFSDNFQITSAIVKPNNMRGWVAFNVSQIPSDAWVLRAQFLLRLWQKSPNDPSNGFGDSTGRIYGVYRITQLWKEDKVTWANQPNYTEDHHAVATVPQGEGGWNSSTPIYMEWDTTDIVRDWQSGIKNYGFMVRDTQENSPILYSTQFFTHNQVPNQSYFPRLVVTYVRPQSIVVFAGILLAEGLSVAILWRKKRM